jgi:NAD(P)-dependent dehydrogenase (short-subunit alcohol dehydrogenase family)
LAIEWAEYGVRVNALAPGYIKTDLVENLVASGAYDLKSIEKRTPMGRLGTPQEVADAAVFLASDRARFITGQVLGIDGGWSSYGYL